MIIAHKVESHEACLHLLRVWLLVFLKMEYVPTCTNVHNNRSKTRVLACNKDRSTQSITLSIVRSRNVKKKEHQGEYCKYHPPMPISNTSYWSSLYHQDNQVWYILLHAYIKSLTASMGIIMKFIFLNSHWDDTFH